MESEKKEGVNTCLCDLCAQHGDGNNCKFHGFDLIELPVYCNGFEPKPPQFTDEELKTLMQTLLWRHADLTRKLFDPYDENYAKILKGKQTKVYNLEQKIEDYLLKK